jgi:hypothetical protein
MTQAESLATLEEELREVMQQIRDFVMKTDARLFTVRPDPMRWSAAECLSHLSITTAGFLPSIRKGIEDAKAKGSGSDREPAMDWLGAALRWFMEPPFRSKVKTSQPFVPKSVRAKADALAEFESTQGQLIELVRQSSGVDISGIKIRSAFDQRVRYNVFSAFRIIAAHERRHLWQARNVIAEIAEGMAQQVNPS